MQILVNGTGRSGTVLVSRLIGLHPDVYFPKLNMVRKNIFPEIRILTDPDGCIDLIDNLSTKWNPQRGDNAVHRFERMVKSVFHKSFLNLSRFLNMGLYGGILPRLRIAGPKYGYSYFGDIIERSEVIRVLKDFTNDLIYDTYDGVWLGSESWQIKPKIRITRRYEFDVIAKKCGEFVDNIFQINMRKEGASHWCDHTPSTLLHPNYLRHMFSDLKVIHVYRDPRDVISSLKGRLHGSNDPVKMINWIKEIWKRWFEIRDTYSSSELLEIRLEDVITDYSSSIKKIFSFLNLTPTTEILNQNFVHKKSTGRWKRDLSESQIDKINKELGEICDLLGYQI